MFILNIWSLCIIYCQFDALFVSGWAHKWRHEQEGIENLLIATSIDTKQLILLLRSPSDSSRVHVTIEFKIKLATFRVPQLRNFLLLLPVDL